APFFIGLARAPALLRSRAGSASRTSSRNPASPEHRQGAAAPRGGRRTPMEARMSDTKRSGCDLLYGLTNIARYIEISDRQAAYLIEKKALPAFKIDGKVCATRGAIDAWVSEKASSASNGQAAGSMRNHKTAEGPTVSRGRPLENEAHS